MGPFFVELFLSMYSRMNSSKLQPLFLLIRNNSVLENVFPLYTCSSKPYPIFSSRVIFQSSAIVSRISSCLVSMCTFLSAYNGTLRFASKRGLLSRWTRLGATSRSDWNGSISSRGHTRPIGAYFGTDPFGTIPVKTGP